MRKKSTRLLFLVLGFVSFASCKDGDKQAENYEREIGDSIKVGPIMYGHDQKDTAVIAAYLDDKTVITINDIDPGDTSYSTRTKVLYKPGPDGKLLAVVYGFKTHGKGMAVIQKVGEKPQTLKEKEMDGDVRVYSDGNITLQKSGTFAFLDGVQYEEIR